MNAVIHAEVTITYVFFLFPSTHINTYTLRYICLYVHVYVHTHTDTIHAIEATVKKTVIQDH